MSIHLCILILEAIILAACWYFYSPFKYPTFTCWLSVGEADESNIYALLDDFLSAGHFDIIQAHQVTVKHWKRESELKLARSLFKQHRQKQYQRAADDSRAYNFVIARLTHRPGQATRKTEVPIDGFSYSYKFLKQRYEQLGLPGQPGIEGSVSVE